MIPGPAGTLEAALSGTSADIIAVLCHPHPLYGGSMDDGVLAVLSQVLEAGGAGCLRFNFRGVGASSGAYNGNGGEVDDLRAVLEWQAAEFPGRQLWLGGYSFGASIVSQLAAATSATKVLLIAPPAGHLPLVQPDGGMPVDIIVGDNDAFVDIGALSDWPADRIHIIEGADHFFSGARDALTAAIEGCLARA